MMQKISRQTLPRWVWRACLAGWVTGLAPLATGAAEPDLKALDAQSEQPTLPMQLLWGDLHLHSNLSADAFVLENRTLGPDAAFRFARGETITSTDGTPARLKRPLDFLAVTDHAEYLGVFDAIAPAADESGESSSLKDEKQAEISALLEACGMMSLLAAVLSRRIVRSENLEVWQ